MWMHAHTLSVGSLYNFSNVIKHYVVGILSLKCVHACVHVESAFANMYAVHLPLPTDICFYIYKKFKTPSF